MERASRKDHTKGRPVSTERQVRRQRRCLRLLRTGKAVVAKTEITNKGKEKEYETIIKARCYIWQNYCRYAGLKRNFLQNSNTVRTI